MKLLFVFITFMTISVQAADGLNYKNSQTRYRGKRPEGVCFETSEDRYLIKKRHTVSALMNFFKLRPLYCEDCSVETAQKINEIENVDLILPGQILTVPKKCANFTWQDNFNYEKYNKYSDEEIDGILKKRELEKTEPQDYQAGVIESQPITTNAEAVSTTKLERKKVYVTSYNKAGVEPFGVYSEIRGSTQTVGAKVRSDLGKGIRLFYNQSQDEQNEFFGSAYFYQTEILDDINGTTISNKTQTPVGLQAGYKYYLNNDLALIPQLNLDQNYVFEEVSPTNLAMKAITNITAKASVDYAIYRSFIFNVYLGGGLGALLPTSLPGGQSQVGTLVDADLKGFYKLEMGRIYAGINFANKEQKNSDYKFNEQSLTYKTGFYYLF